ncbi:MAG: S-layer homology domain-containing protein [Bacillota bacterium]
MFRVKILYLGLFSFFFAIFLVYPAFAIQPVVFDGHLHSKYSDEGLMTKGRDIGKIAHDVQGVFGKEKNKIAIALAVTDHSDYEPGKTLFTDADWSSRQHDICQVHRVIVIPGEEVTIGNGKTGEGGTQGHFLTYGLKSRMRYPFSGLGDPEDDRLIEDKGGPPGDKTLKIIPPRKDISEILKELKSQGAFGYIAHPNGGFIKSAELSRKVFTRKDEWTRYAWDKMRPFVGTVVKGIEILSAGRDHSIQYAGIAQSKVWYEWSKFLSQGQNFFVIGGSDNHNGEFTFGGVVGPDIGSSFTYLLFDDNQPITESTVEWALRNGHTVASSGPFVNLTVTPPGTKLAAGPGDTVTVKKGDEVTITVEWNEGLLRGKPLIGAYLTIYRCFKSEKGKGIEPLPGWNGKPVAVTGETSFSYKIEQDQFLFAKIEVAVDYSPLLTGADWYTAYTSPVFVDPPGVKRPAVDVALVIDCSGSMSWNDPQGLRKEAAEQFIDLMQEGEKVAVVGFNHEAYLFAPLREIKGPADRESLKQAVDRVFAWGWTDIDEGLLLADQELTKEMLPEVRKAVILLTDGVPAPNPYQEAHRQLKEKGIRVYTIGLGSDTDPVLLQRIAQETGGRYFAAPDAQALTAIYQELSAAVAGGEAQERESEQFTAAGETRTRALTVAPGTLQATFGITWTGSDFDFILTRPDGRELTPQSPDPDYSFVKGPTYAYYIVDNPAPGDWTYTITAKEIPPGGEAVNLSLTALVQTPPEISLSGPASGSLLKEPFTVSATAYDPDGISEFYWFLDNYELTSVPAEGSPSVLTAAYTLDPAQLPDGRHTITAWAADANFTPAGADLDFIVDNTPPAANAGPDREASAGEEIIFDATGSRDAALYLWDFGDGVSTGSDYPYAAHIYAQPGSYTVTLTVYDDAGNRAAATCRVTVRPVASGGGGYVDLTPPAVKETMPADGARGVPVDQLLTLTFSEKIKAGKNFSSIVLQAEDGSLSALDQEIAGEKLILKPQAKLSPGTRYTLTLPAAAVQDLWNNPLKEAFSFSFTTAALRPAPVPFPDVPPGHWAAQAIGTLAARGVLAGYPDGSFKPEKPLTRAELAALLSKFLGLKAAASGDTFADVPPGAWYAGAVAAVHQKGLMSGASGRFRPDAALTREELAAVALRAAGISIQDLTPAFADAQRIAPWARQAVATAAAAGLVTGVGKNRFAPKEPVTRAQAAAILYRLAARLGQSGVNAYGR